MRLLSRVGHRFRSLVRKQRLDEDLSEELHFHIERQIGENIARGMTPEHARRAALRELSGLDQIAEECRDMRRTQYVETLLQDIRFGVRTFRRQPGFTFCVLALLAFGVGSTTAIFSIVNGVLLTALPYRAPENLVRIFGTWEHGSREGISPPDFVDYRQRNTSFESVAGASNSTPLLNLQAAGDPEQVRSRNVTAGFFNTLGIRPLLGREFRREEETWKGPAVAILSYGLWQRQYGGNPSIAGRALTINGVSYTIVGVLPPFFNFLGATDIFTPAQYNPAPGMRSARVLIMIGRLKPGENLRRAQIGLDLIGRRLQEDHSQFDRGWSATAAPLTDEVVEVSVDARVLAFTLAVSVLTGVAFGLVPALGAGHAEIGEGLKAGDRSVTKQFGLRDVLVVSEVTVSVMLLIGAGLLVRSLIQLENVNPGFEATNILTTRIALPGSKYSDGTGTKVTAFWREAIHRVEAIPGVERAAVTSELPLSGLNNPTPRMATAPGGKSHLLYLRSVSPSYWNVMRIPLRAGRFLGPDDRKSTPRVVVINEQFRKDVFGDQDPVGQRLTFDFQERQETENYQAVIVGVAGDVRHTSLASPPFREAYIPLEQSPLFNYDLVVRTAISPKSIAGSLKRAVWSLDRDESIGTLRTVDEVVDLGLTQPRFRGYVLGGFAAMAVILSAAGLYGLLSFLVSQRSREIGIRMALGALPADILRVVLVKGVSLTVTGLSIGLLMAFAFARVMSTLVYGIGLTDPLTFVAGTAVLLLVSFLASYLPARRAMSLNPVDVLRSE